MISLFLTSMLVSIAFIFSVQIVPFLQLFFWKLNFGTLEIRKKIPFWVEENFVVNSENNRVLLSWDASVDPYQFDVLKTSIWAPEASLLGLEFL